MRFLSNFVTLLAFLGNMRGIISGARTCCNVRLWYLNVVGDDIFNAKLNQDQQNLKDSIESFVTKASKNKNTECHILEMYNDMLKETFQYGPDVPLVQVTCSETVTKVDHNDASQKNIGENVKSKAVQSKKTVEQKTATNKLVQENLNELGAIVKEAPKPKPYSTSDQRNTNMETSNDETDLDETNILSDPIEADDIQVNEKEQHDETILNKKMAADDHKQDREGKDLSITTNKSTAAESETNTVDALREQERKNENGVRNDEHTILDRKEDTLRPKVGKSNTEFIELVKTMRGIISKTVVFPVTKTLKKHKKGNKESSTHNLKPNTLKTKLHNKKVIDEIFENEKVSNIKHSGTMKGEHDEQQHVDTNTEDKHHVNKVTEIQHQHHTTFGLCFSPVCVKIDIFNLPPVIQSKQAEQNIFERLQSKTAAVKDVTRKENTNAIDRIKVVLLEESNKNIKEPSEIHVKRKPHSRKKGFRCPQGKSCNRQCHLLYSLRHCLSVEGQGQHKRNITENTKTYLNDLKNTASKHPRQCHQKISCNNYCYLIHMLRHCLPVDRLTNQPETAQNIDKKEHKNDKDHHLIDNKVMFDKNLNVAIVKMTESIKDNSVEKLIADSKEIANKQSAGTEEQAMSVEGQSQLLRNITENTKTFLNNLKTTASKLPRKCHQKKICNNYCYLIHMLRHCLPVDKLTNQPGTAKNIDKKEHKNDEDHHFYDNKVILDKKLKVAKVKMTEHVNDTSEEKIIEDLKEITTKQSARTEEQTKDKHTHLDQELGAFPFDRLEKIINQQTNEYGKKIQTLELMIIKLENQVLFEKLDKQNHSSTIMRLENMILKLENDLLRMYKNQETLKQESEKCSKQHYKFLEIVQQQEKKFKTYPELPDKTSESLELISKHQLLIKELSQTISNQSKIVDHLKSKSKYLEEQNNILRQMITNQTVFMNKIAEHVQNLTEQNMKYKSELDNVRKSISDMISNKTIESVSNISGSEIFVKNLDSLASDEKVRIDSIDINTGNNHKIRSPTTFCNYSCMISRVKEWASCHYYSVVNENKLVPYKTLFWEKCSYGPSAESKKVTKNVDLPKISDSEAVSESKDSINNERKEKTTNSESESDLEIDESVKAASPTVLGKESLESPIPTGVLENKGDAENNIKKHLKSEEMHLETEKNKNAKQVYGTIKLDSCCVLTQINLFESLCKFKSMPHIKNIRNNLFSGDINASIKHQADLQKLEDPFGQSDDSNKQAKSENEQASANEAKADGGEEQNKQNYDNSNDKPEQLNSMDIPKNQNSTKERDQSSTKESSTKESSTKEKEENTIQKKSTTIEHPTDPVSDDIEKHKGNDKKVLDLTKNSTNISESLKDKTPELSQREQSKGDPEKVKTEQRKESDKKVIDLSKNNTNISEKSNDITPESNLKEKSEINSGKIKTEQANFKKEQRPEAKESKKEKKRKLQSSRKTPIYLNRQQKEPKDCYDHYKKGSLRDGAYDIKPVASDSFIKVFCDMQLGGWTILQKRQDGTTSFFKDWFEYKHGFGGVYGEHWLGNDNLHLLTNQDYYRLRVDLGDWNNNKRYAYYDYVLVDNEDEGYRLHIDGFSGDAGDGLSKHNGSKFSTKDVDNDRVVKEFGGSCANRFHGAGWYYKCYASNLNGKYYKSSKIPKKKFDGVTWKPWTGSNYSLKTVQMKIRPASVNH